MKKEIKCQKCGSMNVFDLEKFDSGSHFIECKDCKERIFFMVAKTAHIPKDKRSVAESIYDLFCNDKNYNSNALIERIIYILHKNFPDINVDCSRCNMEEFSSYHKCSWETNDDIIKIIKEMHDKILSKNNLVGD